jgi:hypothetical protein
MYSRLFGNRSTYGFYSPQKYLLKNSTNLNEIEIYQDEILKLKMELNKKVFEFQELRIEYNRLDKAYKKNIILLEKLIKEANNNVLNNLSYDKDKDKEEVNQNCVTNNLSPKILYKTMEYNRNASYRNKNNLINIINKNHLNQKLQQEIIELKNEMKEKETIINNYKNNANVLKYKELDKKFSQIFTELIQTRENNDKLQALCYNLNSKINNYKDKIKKLNNKYNLIENENHSLKEKLLVICEKKLDTSINKIDIIQNSNKKINNNDDKDKEEEIKNLKDKIHILEEEIKKLKEK